MNLIPLLIGLFLFLLFLVTIILSAKTWRGWQIAIVCLTFLAGMGLTLVAAMTTKTHVTWRKQHANTEEQLEAANRENYELTYGDPVLVEDEALLQIQERLKRVLLDRGRVWRGVTPAAPAGDSVTVSTVPPDTPEDQIKPNGIDTNTILYAFKEVPLTEDRNVPAAFLGEFRVTQADARSVTLEPTMPLDGQQRELLANPSGTWTLYEMMPLDSHQAFSGQDPAGEMLDDTDKPAFGEMNEQTLRQTFAAVTGLPPEDPRVTELIAPYVKDGRPATEQDISGSPENIWQKLEFQQAHQERVDSNNLDPGLSGNFFDPEGYAEATQLRTEGEGDEATIRANDIGLFPYSQDDHKRLVDELIGSGAAQSLGPYFVRDLRDYENAFHDIQRRFIAVNADIRRAQRDIEALNNSIRSTQQQTAYRQEERSKLQTDRDKYNAVLAQLTEATDALMAERKSLKEALSQLYARNLALSIELTDLHAQLTEVIDRRTAAAAASLE